MGPPDSGGPTDEDGGAATRGWGARSKSACVLRSQQMADVKPPLDLPLEPLDHAPEDPWLWSETLRRTVGPTLPATRREFPLRLGRKATAQPRRVFLGFVPADVDDGIVLRGLGIVLRPEAPVLPIRDRVFLDQERQQYSALRSFIVPSDSRGAPPHELARRDPDPRVERLVFRPLRGRFPDDGRDSLVRESLSVFGGRGFHGGWDDVRRSRWRRRPQQACDTRPTCSCG